MSHQPSTEPQPPLRQDSHAAPPVPWPAWWSTRTRTPLQPEGDWLVGRDPTDRVRILRGIPRFVTSESYAANFGDQWKKFRLTQLDTQTGFPITRDRLQRCLGHIWDRLAGLHVLEVGCGAGRFTEVLLAKGAYVTSVDLSEAVDANAENFPVSERHRIAQADLRDLPFAPMSFDVVLCLGVLQHTPDPDASVAALAGHVRPGGALVIDHYTFEWGRVTSLKPAFRAVLKRMPRERTLRGVEALVDMFLPWHARLRNSRVLWSLLCRVSPITTFFKSYPYLPENVQREWALLDTHDSLTDWFKHLRNRAQVAGMVERAGLRVARCDYGGNGVEAIGVRDPGPSVDVA